MAGNGTLGPAGDSGSARSAQLGAPWGVVTDAEGNIYIADTFNQRIRIVDSQGQIRTVVANCQLRPGWAGDGGSTTFASLNYPVGLAADQFGNIFIADLGNNRVRGVAPVVSARQSVCPSPSGTPGARGTTQSPISSPHPRVVSGRHDQGPLMSDMPTRASSHPFAVSRPAMPAPRTLPRVGAQSSGQSRQPQPAAAIPIGRAISSIGDSLNAPILKWSAPSIIVLTIVTVAFLLHQRRKKRRRHPHR